MTTTARLKFTSVRTRIVNGNPLIGLKHTATAAGDMPVTTTWVEMPPEDVAKLIKTLQDTLAELNSKPAGHEEGNS